MEKSTKNELIYAEITRFLQEKKDFPCLISDGKACLSLK